MTTKLELTQLLATRNTELSNARLRISVLEGELALRPRTTPVNTGRWNTKGIPSTTFVRPAWMEAARAKAMATGSVVLA